MYEVPLIDRMKSRKPGNKTIRARLAWHQSFVIKCIDSSTGSYPEIGVLIGAIGVWERQQLASRTIALLRNWKVGIPL